MHEEIRSHFDELCTRHRVDGDVLEVGATGTPDTLLTLAALSRARRRIGLNAEPQPPLPGVEMVTADANAMTLFADASFDAVLCNSMLEHDARFWLSLGEMKRVLRPGGLLMVGVPAFTERRSLGRRFRAGLARLWSAPLPGARHLDGAAASTPTLAVHRFPADYYRFGIDAMREIFFAGMEVVSIDELMTPPRLVGVARRL